MTTLKDIARETGLSMNTVSRAIRQSGYLSPRTAERVRAAVERLDYHPNRAAQDLRRRRSRQIMVIAESHDYLHIEKLAAIRRYAARRGYIMSAHFTSEDDPQDSFRARLPDLLGQTPAGLILIVTSEAVIDAARTLRRKLPCVMVSFDRVPDIDCVYIDRAGGVREAIHYLHRQGRRRIAFCDLPNTRNRKPGYLRAIGELDLPELILPCSAQTLPEIRREGERLAHRLAVADNPPDAVQTSDYMAAGLLAGFAAAGIRVPEEIAVIGFDDRELAGMLNPPLTTLAQPNAEVGTACVRMLFTRMEGKRQEETPENVAVPMRLVIRNSA